MNRQDESERSRLGLLVVVVGLFLLVLGLAAGAYLLHRSHVAAEARRAQVAHRTAMLLRAKHAGSGATAPRIEAVGSAEEELASGPAGPLLEEREGDLRAEGSRVWLCVLCQEETVLGVVFGVDCAPPRREDGALSVPISSFESVSLPRRSDQLARVVTPQGVRELMLALEPEEIQAICAELLGKEVDPAALLCAWTEAESVDQLLHAGR